MQLVESTRREVPVAALKLQALLGCPVKASHPHWLLQAEAANLKLWRGALKAVTHTLRGGSCNKSSSLSMHPRPGHGQADGRPP